MSRRREDHRRPSLFPPGGGGWPAADRPGAADRGRLRGYRPKRLGHPQRVLPFWGRHGCPEPLPGTAQRRRIGGLLPFRRRLGQLLYRGILSIQQTIQEKREDVSIIFKGACS